MNRRSVFDAASFILGADIRNRTHTHTHKPTVNDIPTPCLSVCVDNKFGKTDREYSLAATDDLIRFWRSKVKVIHALVQICGGEDIDVDAGALKRLLV